MLKIGDLAKHYNISNRTLRYWEEKGILNSFRAENSYRYYDAENVMRIKQIVLLRKLKMPLADIEHLFLADDVSEAIRLLKSHLQNLREGVFIHTALANLVEQIVQHIQREQSMEEVFLYLEEQCEAPSSEHEMAPQTTLPERINSMAANSLDNVRIVKLPAMTVASYRAESATPEDDCSKVFNQFVLQNNLHKRDGYRYLGFNNPDPTPGNPIYGYEMWITIPEDFNVPEPLVKKNFEGGLYASIPTFMNEIGERWRLLYNWCNNSEKYVPDFSRQWLEECSMDFETFTSDQVDDREKQLDLLNPIKLK